MVKEKKSGIYVIERIETGQKYVGLGKKVEQRMNMYHDGSDLLNRAIKKYGEEKFKRYVIERCLIDNLPEREKYWIKELHSHMSEGGYNMTWGGDAPMEGKHHSEESKKRISQTMVGIPKSEETKRKMSESQINHLVSIKARQKISVAQKGRIVSIKTRELMSKNNSGEGNPMYGISPSIETRKKIGDGNRGKIVPEEVRIRIRKNSSGKKSNNFNKKSPNATSEYHGVSRTIVRKKYIYWHSQLTSYGIHICIKRCKTEIEAARLYDKYIVEHNLSNQLNFPEERGREK